MTGGASSKIFWKRRCVSSRGRWPPTTCTSWRVLVARRTSAPRGGARSSVSCIMNIGEPLGHLEFETCTKLVAAPRSRSCGCPCRRRPRRLEHHRVADLRGRGEGLLERGDHRSRGTSAAGSRPTICGSTVSPSPDHGICGTFAVCARMFAAILSPSAAITAARPTDDRRDARRLGPVGQLGVLARVAPAGHAASTPSRFAMSMISSTFA